MTGAQHGLALRRLIEAMEAEILAAPEPEVLSLVAEPSAKAGLGALRALVADAVKEGEESIALPPEVHGGPLSLRRP